MPDGLDARLDLRALLDVVEAAPPVEAVDVLAAEMAKEINAREVSFLIADFSGQSLVRLTRDGTAATAGMRRQGGEEAETVPLAGTPYERAVRTQQVVILTEGDGARLLAPVTDRGDAVGILEVALSAYPDTKTVAYAASAAHALAYIVIANRRYTDLFEWGQRSTPLSLAAEIQRRLLPASFTCEAGQFTLAGWLEPAADVCGDTFDYALDRDLLYVSVTDAMGHDIDAALLATLAVGSLRNTRRRGTGLTGQAAAANAAVSEGAKGNRYADAFVTGQLVQIDLASGTAAIVNAGHPHPLRVRDGQVAEISLAVDLPFGLRPGTGYRAQPLPLQPGDRVVFVTDGMLEREAARANIPAVLAGTCDLHPREVIHALVRAVLRATGGRLRDDATALCLDWYGGPPREREASGGASSGRASAQGVLGQRDGRRSRDSAAPAANSPPRSPAAR